jgi:hypothetical protein
MTRLLTDLITFAVLLPAALAACGGGDEENAAQPETDESRAAARTAPGDEPPPGRDGSAPTTRRPRIEILRPRDGQTVDGRAATVSVSVKGFKVVNQRVRPPFPPPVAGKGHVHFYLDTKKLPTTHSPPATGTYRSMSDTTYTWTGVAPGRHSLAVQLVGKDHAPLSPPVKDRITVDVE